MGPTLNLSGIQKRVRIRFSHFVAAAEEIDGIEFGTHGFLFFIGHVMEGHAVRSEVQSDELHDAFSGHNVATVMTDDVDHLLGIILMLAGTFDVTMVPTFDNGI